MTCRRLTRRWTWTLRHQSTQGMRATAIPRVRPRTQTRSVAWLALRGWLSSMRCACGSPAGLVLPLARRTMRLVFVLYSCRVLRQWVGGEGGRRGRRRGAGVWPTVSCPRQRGYGGETDAGPPNAAGMTLPVATRTCVFSVLRLFFSFAARSGGGGTVSTSTLRASLPHRVHGHIQAAPRV